MGTDEHNYLFLRSSARLYPHSVGVQVMLHWDLNSADSSLSFAIALRISRAICSVNKLILLRKVLKFCGRILRTFVWKYLPWDAMPGKCQLQLTDYHFRGLISQLANFSKLGKIISHQQIQRSYPFKEISSNFLPWKCLMFSWYWWFGRSILKLITNRQSWTRFSSWILRPGHYTYVLTFSRHFELPWWPACNLSRISGLSWTGMMILLPHINKPSWN